MGESSWAVSSSSYLKVVFSSRLEGGGRESGLECGCSSSSSVDPRRGGGSNGLLPSNGVLGERQDRALGLFNGEAEVEKMPRAL